MPRRERSTPSPRASAPRSGAGWLGVLFGVAAGAALFLLAAPYVSLWIGRTLASNSEAHAPAGPATAVSAPIDWSEGGDAAPAEAAPATPSPEDALKGRSEAIDPPTEAPIPADDAPPA